MLAILEIIRTIMNIKCHFFFFLQLWKGHSKPQVFSAPMYNTPSSSSQIRSHHYVLLVVRLCQIIQVYWDREKLRIPHPYF